jgi:cullin-associated NEDD8-dissociated protein 1
VGCLQIPAISIAHTPRSDMSNQADVFTQAIDRFTADNEEIRTAAAFAAGNIAIGNSQHFLPPIIKLVRTDASRRLYALHAIKEVGTQPDLC